ncbi:MAG TPA: HEAT repeat domain-containing protein [candidate division WOR-3 bacterium]|uniref:HEAT repeat domain-containing protein n=1 Tax=candidate division WOR-3 bacterium TaxID=2052148 RepID=A0A9C9EKD5_UNCW3|nr:HEAT repeat domain-containing protein [candidate division WOR-3 bacterium]
MKVTESVQDIVVSMIKTVKAIQMYGLNHPSSKYFYDPFYKKITGFLKNTPELNLQIEQFSILYSNEKVYEETEKDISVAFRLFRDGIRSISFSKGLTSDELLLFLETISRVTREQDIALNLWECDFSHISFYVVEEEEEVIDYRAPEVKVENIDYDAKLREILEKEKLDLQAPINPELSEDELNYLKAEISKTTKESFLAVAITTLLNFLRGERTQEIIDSLVELLERCIDTQDFYHARLIVHQLKQHAGVNPIDKFENETTIMAFRDVVNLAEDDVFNEFIAFIGLFSKKSIIHFIRLLVQVKRKDRLATMRSRLAYIIQDDPTPILTFLNSKNTAILINAIAILGLLKLKGVVTYLEPLIEHPDPYVRIEVISALEKIGKGAIIAKFLDDEDTRVRIKTLQVLTRIRYLRIYDNLVRRIKNKQFLDLDFAEQKEYFNCLVATGGKEVTKQLKKILFKWKLFGRKRYSTMRKLAAMALALLKTDDALQILQRGVKKRNKDIKNACKMALKQI